MKRGWARQRGCNVGSSEERRLDGARRDDWSSWFPRTLAPRVRRGYSMAAVRFERVKGEGSRLRGEERSGFRFRPQRPPCPTLHDGTCALQKKKNKKKRGMPMYTRDRGGNGNNEDRWRVGLVMTVVQRGLNSQTEAWLKVQREKGAENAAEAHRPQSKKKS